MSETSQERSSVAVADIRNAMETIAPSGLAQAWDNVGLLAGDPRDEVDKVLACIDLTSEVVDEAIDKKVGLVLAYHPPIFKPVASICADSRGPEAAVFRCIRSGIAIYSVHTALDAADGGTNDVMASRCGARSTEPLEYVDDPGVSQCKLAVFVPQPRLEQVAKAMFEAGAGNIGDYTQCSYRTEGQGTFLGGDTTQPSIGKRGQLEFVDETRLEVIVPTSELPRVVSAMVKAHPYEEPAFDVYPVKPRPVRGIGRVGRLSQSTTLRMLARKLRRSIKATCVQTVGPHDRVVDRVIVVVGAAGSLPFRLPLMPHDVIVTGEIRHHDALTIQRVGCTAIALGHWASERPALSPLAEKLREHFPKLSVEVSAADQDPFLAL